MQDALTRRDVSWFGRGFGATHHLRRMRGGRGRAFRPQLPAGGGFVYFGTGSSRDRLTGIMGGPESDPESPRFEHGSAAVGQISNLPSAAGPPVTESRSVGKCLTIRRGQNLPI